MPDDAAILRAPALRISNIVRGRQNVGGRVRYFVDPEGINPEKAIPEDVVLKRWRRRTMEGHSFHGCRLGPNLWRAVARALGVDAERIVAASDEELESIRKVLSENDTSQHWKVPDATSLRRLFTALGETRLQKIVDRHLDPERADRFGTPDLFLYALDDAHPDRVSFFRLVEVKMPRERVSRDQEEEILFLRSIGVHARILRLIESM